MFDSDRLREIGLDPSTLYPFVTPRPPPLSATTSRIQSSPKEDKKGKGGMFLRKLDRHSDSEKMGSATATLPSAIGTEEEEELNDALSPVYDQLELKWYWWILEIVPMKFRYQRGSAEGSKWVSYFGCASCFRFLPPNTSDVYWLIGRTWRDHVKFHNSARMV